MNADKRKTLMLGLFGTGWLGLRALASGLPLAVLANPRRAEAALPSCHATLPQYLINFTSADGDPLGNNAPGAYGDSSIFHPPDARMAASTLMLGGQAHTAARPWTELDPAILARTCFFHHGTYTNAHGDHPKVSALMGAMKKQEMMVSMMAKQIAPCLETVQTEPVVLAEMLLTFKGAVLPLLHPTRLKAALASPAGPLGQLQQIRDLNVDRLNALYKQHGTPAQKSILDRYALSQTQARSLSQQLLNDLSTIQENGRIGQNIAAAVLIKMNVSPVVTLRHSFGGDNHEDQGLRYETEQTLSSLAALNDLYARLRSYQLEDKVTIAHQNVFGRTFKDGPNGRNHNGLHNTSVLIGSRFKASVVGGITPDAGSDFRAQGIDSATGAASDGGDVKFEDTLGAVAKTLGAALGIDKTVLDDEILRGKVVAGALV